MTIIRAMDRSLKARLIGASVLVLARGAGRSRSCCPAARRRPPTQRTPTDGGQWPDAHLHDRARQGRDAGGRRCESAATSARRETSPLARRAAGPRADSEPAPRRNPAARSPVKVDCRARRSAATSRKPATRAGAPPRSSASAAVRAPSSRATRAAGHRCGTVKRHVVRAGRRVRVGRVGAQAGRGTRGRWVSRLCLRRQRDGKTLHRVRVGPESARAAADALAGRLKARGLPVSLVAND